MKLIKKLVMVSMLGLSFGLGFVSNEVADNKVEKVVSAETVKQVEKEDNIFSQEFVYEGVVEDAYYVLQSVTDASDFIHVSEDEMNNQTINKGQHVVVTFNHDDIVSVLVESNKEETIVNKEEIPTTADIKIEPKTEQKPQVNVQTINSVLEDKKEIDKPVTQQVKENVIESQQETQDVEEEYVFKEKDDSYINSVRQYVVKEDTDNMLIHAMNVDNENEIVLLENNGFKSGDIVEVAYGESGYHDDMVRVDKLAEKNLLTGEK